MKRKWSKLISGAICVSLALPGSFVYAGEPESVQEYDVDLEWQAEGRNDDGMFDLPVEDMNDVEVFDAEQVSAEPETADSTSDGGDETIAEEDDSLIFSASEDVFTDGNPEAEFFVDDEQVMAAGESVPIDAEHFPDNNFRAYLLDLESSIGDGDDVLDKEEISKITEINSYDFSNADESSSLVDYTGIEYLTALEVLVASSTESAVSFSLDVSKNKQLRELTIDVSYYSENGFHIRDNQQINFGRALTSLEKLSMSGVALGTFDASVFPGLTQVDMRTCSIEEIYISGCTSLNKCDLQYIQNIKSLEFGTLPALTELSLMEMEQLNKVKLPTAPNLEKLTIQARLDEISLPAYPKLTFLDLGGNRLKELDLRSCPNLETADISFNELVSLNVTGLTKLNYLRCLLNNLKEIKGEKDKLVGYPEGQREADIKLYGNILYTSQIWGDERLWLARISNYRGLTPEGENPGYGVDAAMCKYFTVDSFKGDSTDVSFDLYENQLDIVIPVTLHLTRAENTKLDVPQKLIVSDAWSSGIELYWNHVTGADGYYVYRKINDSAYKKIATVKGGHINTYTDKVTTWAKYSYKIKAYGKVNGKTATSKYSKVNSCMKDYTWKSKLTAKPGTKSAALTWKKLNGATGYQIYRATSKKGKYTKIATIKKGTTVKYTDSKLQSKKTYYYKIRPYLTVSKKNTYGSFSGIVNVKTK